MPEPTSTRPLPPRAKLAGRVRAMAEVGWAMMFHARLKLAGTVAGVVFAVLLSNFALGTFFGLLAKSTLLPRNANADVWIVPHGAEILGQGVIGTDALSVARTTPGVERAAPLLVGPGSLAVPAGRREGVTIVGATEPYDLGGPWNVVAGDLRALRQPDTFFLESGFRKTFGGVNVGSVREVNGRRTVVGGFTWGLAPFGASYAYTDYETAREYLGTASDQTSFVLVRTRANASPAHVAAQLRARIHDVDVYTTAEFTATNYRQILIKTPIGVTFGFITFFGLLIGVVVVGLAMFSSVIDNLREFGMLKAIGCTNADLTLLLLAQSVIAGGLGGVLGLAIVAALAHAMRSPNIGLVLPWQLSLVTGVGMIGLCICASLLGLAKIRKVEPGMVFR